MFCICPLRLCSCSLHWKETSTQLHDDNLHLHDLPYNRPCHDAGSIACHPLDPTRNFKHALQLMEQMTRKRVEEFFFHYPWVWNPFPLSTILRINKPRLWLLIVFHLILYVLLGFYSLMSTHTSQILSSTFYFESVSWIQVPICEKTNNVGFCNASSWFTLNDRCTQDTCFWGFLNFGFDLIIGTFPFNPPINQRMK